MKNNKRCFNKFGVVFLLLLVYFVFHCIMEACQYETWQAWLVEAILIIPAIAGIIYTLRNPKEFLKVGK